MNSCRFFLVRHAETVENASGIVQGQLHGQLSDEGRVQSALIAARLKDQDFDAVFSSDLNRALTTAQIIMAGRPDRAITPDPRLREQGFGIYEGKPAAAMLRPMKRNRADFSTFIPEGGEDPADFCKRVANFYDEVRSFGRLNNVLVVTHYGVINALLRLLVYNMPESLADQTIGNGAVTILDIDEHDLTKIEIINDIGHLKSR